MRPLVFSFRPRSQDKHGWGEVEFCIQGPGDLLVLGKLTAVVGGDRVHPGCQRFEQANDGLGHRLGSFTYHLGDEGQFGFTLDQCHQRLPMLLANNGIDLPVAKTAMGIYNGRALVNGDLRRDLAPA